MKTRQFFYITAVLTLFLFVTSCSSPAKKAAKDFCTCWQPVADIANLQDTLKAKNLVDSLAAVSLIAIDKFEEARNCSEEKKDSYGKAATKAAFKEKARKLMEKKCPDVYKRIAKY